MAEVGSKKVAFRLWRVHNYHVSLVLLCFLLPLFLPLYWGVALALVCAFFLLKSWEKRMRLKVEKLVRKKCSIVGQVGDMRADYEKEIQRLHVEMEKKMGNMQEAYLEFEDMRREYQRLEEEYRLFKQETEEKFENRDAMLAEYQTTIADQRMIIEKKQNYVVQLEGKVRDLMYEIRSLLQLEEPVTSVVPPIDMLNREEVHDYYLGNQLPAFDLDFQLSNYVEMAEQFTGADHLGSRFLDGSQSYAIDLRRFFDLLREETTGIIFFFSLTEQKILFANNYVKTLLGYSPEKFVNDFPQVVKAGYRIWKEALAKIEGTKRMPLVLLKRGGKEVKVECEMKRISRGPFAGQVLGLIIG